MIVAGVMMTFVIIMAMQIKSNKMMTMVIIGDEEDDDSNDDVKCSGQGTKKRR